MDSSYFRNREQVLRNETRCMFKCSTATTNVSLLLQWRRSFTLVGRFVYTRVLFEQRKTGDFLERPFYFSFLAPWEKSCLRKTNEKLKERKKNENDLILFDQNETIFYPLRSFFFFLIKKKGKRSIKLVRIPRNDRPWKRALFNNSHLSFASSIVKK